MLKYFVVQISSMKNSVLCIRLCVHVCMLSNILIYFLDIDL